MTFLGVRFYIDFEESLVDKRFKGFRDSAIIIRRGAENEPDIEWYYVAPPAGLHLHVLSLFCTATFFDGCVWRITSKLRSEAKPTISEQSDCASSLEFSCESLDRSFESFASLRHRFRLVETRANSLSFPPRPLLASCFRHVCHAFELVSRYSNNVHVCWGSPGTSFWLKMSLHLNVIISHSKYFPNSDWLKAHA